jgi:hypothetical protein
MLASRCSPRPVRVTADPGLTQWAGDQRDNGALCRPPRAAGPRLLPDLRPAAVRTRRPTGRPARPLPVALTAAAVAALPTALLGAALGQEYVGARFFSVVFPALVGVALALAVMSAAGPVRPAGRAVLAALTAGYAAISALLDFRFTDLPYGGPGRWLPPVLAAVVAAVVAAVGFARPAQEWKTSSAIPPR